jgi:hypothetical protein
VDEFEYKLRHALFEDASDELKPEPVDKRPKLNDLLHSGIAFVVVGARCANVYSENPRTTQDIDVLTNDYEKLAEWVHKEFPNLEIEVTDVVIRFLSHGKEVLDIMIPTDDIFKIALHDTRKAGKFRIASAEALLAMKFHSITSSHRKLTRKGQDRVDMANILDHTKVDLKKAAGYVKTLAPGADEAFLAFIGKLKEDFGI